MRNLRLVTLGLLLASAWNSASGAPAHDFAKWEKEISAFEQKDQTNPPPKDALLFIGSSTIRLWATLAEDFPNHKVINRGFGGSQIEDATHFADRVIFSYQPRMIFLRAGGNDLWAGKSPEQVFGDYTNFVQTIHSKLPKTQIVFISLSPSIARWGQANKEKQVNQLVQDYVGKHEGLKYIETYSLPLGADGKPRAELFRDDKLHFNAQGYKLLKESVRPSLPK
jgi:lysophospholipase L1-like esterase